VAVPLAETKFGCGLDVIHSTGSIGGPVIQNNSVLLSAVMCRHGCIGYDMVLQFLWDILLELLPCSDYTYWLTVSASALYDTDNCC